MEVKEAFQLYGRAYPDEQRMAQKTSLALRREKIETTEQLTCLFKENRTKLTCIRGVGEKTMELLGKAIPFFEITG